MIKSEQMVGTGGVENPDLAGGDEENQPSDIRLKTDIQRVGTTAHDLPLYRFRYLGDDRYFEGVMAQDVLEVMPEAVTTGTGGYYEVYYGRLGIKMRAV